MKTIIISSKHISTELKFLLFAFIASFLLNVIAIIIYQSVWNELITSIPFVLLLSIIFYLIVLIIRLLYYTIFLIVKK